MDSVLIAQGRFRGVPLYSGLSIEDQERASQAWIAHNRFAAPGAFVNAETQLADIGANVRSGYSASLSMPLKTKRCTASFRLQQIGPQYPPKRLLPFQIWHRRSSQLLGDR